MDVSYVLPIRRAGAEPPPAEVTAYLRGLAGDLGLDVVVVDNSDADGFAADAAAWGGFVRHLPTDPDLHYRYGKVNNVITGVRHARHETVVLADDDVRWDREMLARAAALLDGAELVRPQNYFTELPWHARWDTARSLLNRALGGDYPGTLVVRRSAFLAVGGYDGDCLFENLELMRTIAAAGGRLRTPLDLYVARLPPTAGHFWSQRVRQAYDELALPGRMAVWLAVVPLTTAFVARRRARALAAVAVVPIALAEAGRRRAGGADVFPASSSLLAPVWVAERGVCVWLALASKARWGGVRYAGTVLRTAAHSRRELRRRLDARGSPRLPLPTGG